MICRHTLHFVRQIVKIP